MIINMDEMPTIFQSLIGMTQDEAEAVCQRVGLDLRVVEEDGKHHIITLEHYKDRLNVALADSKVAKLLYFG